MCKKWENAYPVVKLGSSLTHVMQDLHKQHKQQNARKIVWVKSYTTHATQQRKVENTPFKRNRICSNLKKATQEVANGIAGICGPTKSLPDAARSRPDIVRRPTPPGAVQRPPHQMGKCPRIGLQLGDVNISKLRATLDHIYFILHGMMMLDKLWGLILENCNIPEFWRQVCRLSA